MHMFWRQEEFLLLGYFSWLLIVLLAYFTIDYMILFLGKAKPESDFRLKQIIELLASKSNVSIPKVYVLPYWKRKIFSLSGKVCYSLDLKDILNRSEFESLLLRELYFLEHRLSGSLVSWKEVFSADIYAAKISSDPESLASAISKIGAQSMWEPPIEKRVELLGQM